MTTQNSPPRSSAVRRPPHILIIDDDPAVLRTLERVLRASRPGWEVTAVPTAFDAAERLREARYDVLITDLDMPGASGINLLKHAQQHYPNVVRIVHSARLVDSTRYPSVGKLADVVLTKPVETPRLLETLDVALGLVAPEDEDELPGSVG
jgi:CheY-like chemotaxis protein